MPKLPRELLALLAIVAVAPASASQLPTAAGHYPTPCRYHQAMLAAAGYEPLAQSDGDSSDGSWFDPGRRSAFLTP